MLARHPKPSPFLLFFNRHGHRVFKLPLKQNLSAAGLKELFMLLCCDTLDLPPVWKKLDATKLTFPFAPFACIMHGVLGFNTNSSHLNTRVSANTGVPMPSAIRGTGLVHSSSSFIFQCHGTPDKTYQLFFKPVQAAECWLTASFILTYISPKEYFKLVTSLTS